MRLSDYIKRKNGVPIGHSQSLRNNLNRALGAKNFHTFWTFWNPIFGYYLGRYFYKPFKFVFPTFIALVLTFLVCGIVHDLVTTILRREWSFFFTVWFLGMGLCVVISKSMKMDFSYLSWGWRAFMNLLFIALCLGLTILANRYFHFY